MENSEMNNYISEIGSIVLDCEDIIDSEWDQITVVFDVGEGYMADSGFLYWGEDIEPISASIEENPLLLSNKIKEFRLKVCEEFGSKFKQLLVQIEHTSGRIKIDFEFDDPNRWSITPSNLKSMREELRPVFESQ